MRKFIGLLLFLFTLLFICSCKMKIDGNFISLEDISSRNESDTIDAHGFPIPKIKYLYLYKEQDYDYFEKEYREYIDVFYDNGYVKTYRVRNKDYERDRIRFSFYNSDRYLYVSKISVFFSDGIRSSRLDDEKYPNYYNYHKREVYYISSVKNISDSSKFIAPSFNDIQSYIKNGEVRGNVKSVSNKVFCVKEMFGKDSIILINRYDMQYNKKGKMISLYNKDVSNTYEYDENESLISENRKRLDDMIRVKYEYNDNQMIKKISYYRGNNKVSYVDKKYDSQMRLVEVDYYRKKNYYKEGLILEKKIRFDDDIDYINGIEYDQYGRDIRKYRFDKNYSILKGRINFRIDDEYYNPFKNSIFYYIESRNISVKQYNSNLQIKLESPYEKSSSYEIFTYNKNGDIVKSEMKEGSVRRSTLNEYMMLYKYDSHGNWIERHSVLIYRDNKYEQIKGYIERRDIQYFE